MNRTVRLAGGTITFNGEIDGTTCGGCTLRAIGRAGNITFNENVDFGAGVIILLATGGNIASGSTPPIIRSRNLIIRQEGAFSADLFSETSLITNAVRLFINDASATQTIHPWLATLSGSVFALGGFNATLASITTTTAITNNNRIELRAATITLGGVITSANVSLRADMIAGMVDIRATTGNIAATDIIAAGAAGTGVPTLATAITSLALRQNGAFGAAAPFTFGAEVNTLTLQTTAAQTYVAWMRGDAGAADFNLSLTSTGGVLTLNTNIDVGTGDLTLSGTIITLASNVRLVGEAITLTGAATASNTNLRVAASGVVTLNSDINLGTGTLVLNSPSGITLGGTGTRQITGGTVTFTGTATASNTNINLRVMASNVLTLNSNINIGFGNLTLDGATITLDGSGVRRLIGGAITLTGAIDASGTNSGLLARASVGALTLNDNINIGAGSLTLEGATITLGGTGRRRLIGGAISLTGAIDGSGTNVGLLARASVSTLTINSNINTGTGALTLEATAPTGSLLFGGGVSEFRAGSFSFIPTSFTCTSSTTPRCIDTTP